MKPLIALVVCAGALVGLPIAGGPCDMGLEIDGTFREYIDLGSAGCTSPYGRLYDFNFVGDVNSGDPEDVQVGMFALPGRLILAPADGLTIKLQGSVAGQSSPHFQYRVDPGVTFWVAEFSFTRPNTIGHFRGSQSEGTISVDSFIELHLAGNYTYWQALSTIPIPIPEPVPEPSTLILGGLGCVAFMARRRYQNV